MRSRDRAPAGAAQDLERGIAMARRNPRSGGSGGRGSSSRSAEAKPAGGDTAGAAGRRIRQLLEDQEVTGHIVQLVYDTCGPGALPDAWDEYRCRNSENDRVVPLEFTAESPFLGHFTSWLAHTWLPAMLSEKPKGSAVPDETPTQTFLAQHPDLDPLLAGYLQACIQTPFSFFEVLKRNAGRRFTCRDLFSGTRHVVFDGAASTLLRTHQILYARIIEADGASLIDAAAPWPLPRTYSPLFSHSAS